MSESPRIAAVVLAAGLSRRMGTPKALLPLGDQPLLVRVVEPIVSAGGIAPIVVVTGHAAAEVEKILRPFAVHPVHNGAYATGGMLSSVQTGVAAVAGKADAFFMVLGDQPLVRADTFSAMSRGWTQSQPRPRVVLPTHGGKHGHPILLSADGIDAILSLRGDQTLKSYTSSQSERTLEVAIDDPGVLSDIDTPQDYQAAVQRLAQTRG